jgi:DNA recombination protein RmuC
MERRVILVTPSSLFALCKAVVYGWRVENQHINAKEIAGLGRDLYKRLSVMGGHVAAMGKSLGAAVGKYNEFVGSLETQVLSQARRFEALKVDNQSVEIKELEPIEAAVRPLVRLVSDAGGETLTGPGAAPTSPP